jgi:sugar (pentulose or hexulose) kinase
MAYDLTSKTWSVELFAYAGVATAQLSQVLPSGTIVGEISKTTAERLRLPLGIKVAVGGHDRPMGDLGAGIARPGSVVACSIGTAIGAILVAGTARGIAVRFLVR